MRRVEGGRRRALEMEAHLHLASLAGMRGDEVTALDHLARARQTHPGATPFVHGRIDRLNVRICLDVGDQLGAHEAFESGARLPGKVDAVMETVGRATWSHSVRSLRPGGSIVISGTTSGPRLDDAELTRIFFLQLSVIGSTMGTRDELASLVQLLDATGTKPLVDRTLPMDQAREGFAAMAEGDVFGKIVFTR